MIVSEKKPLDEILSMLENEQDVFIVSCGGCPEACQTGGEVEGQKMAEQLTKAGKNVTSQIVVDELCNKTLAKFKLSRYQDQIDKSQCLLILSCGIGVQATAVIVDKPVYPALNTISMGAFNGIWPSDERCKECGDCVLDLTGGICPFSTCAKGLTNGACGGSEGGYCEVEKERPCGWYLIYERLKKIGQVDKLKRTIKPRDFSKFTPDMKRRRTIFWSIDQKIESQPVAEES